MPATTRPPGESHGSRSRRLDLPQRVAQVLGDREDVGEHGRMRRPPRSAARSSRSRLARRQNLMCAVWQFHASGTRAAPRVSDVVGADRDALAEHGAAGDLRAVADRARRRRRCSRAARSRRRSRRPAARRSARRVRRADADALAEHDEAPDVRARGDVHAALDDRGRHDAAVDDRIARPPRGSRPEPLCHRCRDVALEDVERALQVALGGPDVEPVGARRRSRRGRRPRAAARPRARSRRCGRPGSGRARSARARRRRRR